MSESFNPYCQWLDLAPGTIRPDHYELLGLPAGESDAKRIALAAEQAATKVRSFRPGAQAADWARLLDEIQAAKSLLLDPARKSQYDQKLTVNGRSGTLPPARPQITANVVANSAGAQTSSPANSELFPPGFRPPAAPIGAPAGHLAADVAPSTAPAPVPQTAAPQIPSPNLPVPQPAHGAAADAVYPPGYHLPPQAAPYVAPQAAPYIAPSVAPFVAQTPAGFAAAMAPVPLSAGMPMPYATPATVNPMAPVAVPGFGAAAVGAAPAGLPMSAMPMPSAGLPAGAPLAAAMPTAMNPQASWPAAAPSPATASDAASPNLRKASAASVLLAARKEKQTRNAALLAGTAAGLVVVVGLVAYAIVSSRLNDTAGEREIAKASDPAPAANGNKQPAGASTPAAKVIPTKTPRNESQPADGAGDDDPMPMPMVVPLPMVDTPPMPMPAPPPIPETRPEPKPEVKPEAKPTRQQVANLQSALQKARLALSEHSFDEASAEVAKAEKDAVSSAHQSMVERMRLAIEHARLFRQALAEAVSQLDAAETIKVGSSTTVSIVETFPDKITVRVNGMNRMYSLATMPQGLAVAILDVKRIGGQPDSRLLKAMFVATGKDADADALSTARGWLTEAQGSDSSAAKLLEFLDDDYGSLLKEFDEAEKSSPQTTNTAGAGTAGERR